MCGLGTKLYSNPFGQTETFQALAFFGWYILFPRSPHIWLLQRVYVQTFVDINTATGSRIGLQPHLLSLQITLTSPQEASLEIPPLPPDV